MKRTEARELLMQLMFQMEVQKDFSDDATVKYLSMQDEKDPVQFKYIKEVSEAVRNHKDEIDASIEKFSKGWKLNRIAKIDLTVMRLSIAESYYLGDDKNTPVGASINEAVRLAKKYGSDDSGKFVNGILGEVSRNR